MIYITGDTHGDFKRFSSKNLKKNLPEVTEKDYIIVCGDLGLCWAKDKEFEYNCEFFSQKPFTLLWVQGNHDNYDMLEEYPIEIWNGGKTRHIVKDKVILLERGQVFNIEGKTFFTFGGASSHDIQGGILDRSDIDYNEQRRRAIKRDLPYRVKHYSWWEQELPTQEEMNEGIKNLEAVDFTVDYVISHCNSSKAQQELASVLKRSGDSYSTDVLTDYFDMLEKDLSFKRWYAGHYHVEEDLESGHSILYKSIVPLVEV